MTGTATGTSAPVIELDGLHKDYDTGGAQVHALRGIDLRIDRGELVSVMGPSGAGKTTLMEIIGCLSEPTRGRFRLNGHDVQDLASDALAAVSSTV